MNARGAASRLNVCRIQGSLKKPKGVRYIILPQSEKNTTYVVTSCNCNATDGLQGKPYAAYVHRTKCCEFGRKLCKLYGLNDNRLGTPRDNRHHLR